MEFKYHSFQINIDDFDAEYDSIRDALSTYMWEENYNDYEEYMALRRADFEAENEYQQGEYNSSYNISFGMECAREDYYNRIHQECDWVLERWQERFNGEEIEEKSKAPHKRKNALTGRL